MQLKQISLALLALFLVCSGGLSAQASPDGIAVIVGNRDYGRGLPDVRYALNDAAAMKRFVVDILGYREGNVIVLENAGQAELYATFGSADSPRGKLWGWARPKVSDITVFYSGHGVPGRGDARGYLLPVDADPDTPEINGYPLDLLFANLAAIGARSVTVYLEACFSGDSAGGSLCRNCSGMTVLKRPAPREHGLTVLTAARADEVASWDDEAGLGLFTHHLLRGLYGEADANADREVTLGEIEAWLDGELTYAARRRYRRVQRATVRGELDTPLASISASAPDFRTPGFFQILELNEQMRVAVNGAVNVRAGPGTDYPKAGLLRPGDTVQVTGKLKGRPWLRIAMTEGQTGFVRGDLLAPLNVVPRPARVATPDSSRPAIALDVAVDELWGYVVGKRSATPIHALPDTRARTLASIAPAERLLISGKVVDADWYRVQLQTGDIGFIAATANLEVVRPPSRGLPNSAQLEGFRSFKDCDHCPEMTVITAGQFATKFSVEEFAKFGLERIFGPDLSRPIAVGRFEVTVGQFADYLERSGRKVRKGCELTTEQGIEWSDTANFGSPGFPVTLWHPVTCVSWNEAMAYAEFLSADTGKSYRLLSREEWAILTSAGAEIVERGLEKAGQVQRSCDFENLASEFDPGCLDSYHNAAPVGRFYPNAFGLHDMYANVAEWIDACAGQPENACSTSPTAFIGAGWYATPGSPGHSEPFNPGPDAHINAVGFRVMRAVND